MSNKRRTSTFIRNGKVYQCNVCRADISSDEHIVQSTFYGPSGRAYLFGDVANVVFGLRHSEHMSSGRHLVSDVRCATCRTKLGWKYWQAPSSALKFKEGKCCLERFHLSIARRRSDL